MEASGSTGKKSAVIGSDPDLEHWMGRLDARLRTTCPLVRLAIPGSHDSMMYKMMKHSATTPEAPEFLEWMVKFMPGRVEDWVVTQKGDAMEQLLHGIRYFDIRACLEGQEYMLCHGVFSGESSGPLKQIRAFLDAHPLEVVILDFQHVYRCAADDHQKYCDELVEIFGDLIYRREGNSLATCTLQDLTSKGKQVILIYRDHWDVSGSLWYGSACETPWPNTTNIKTLQTFLEATLMLRQPNRCHVTQCVLTPDGKFIMENLLHNLKSSCAAPVLDSMTPWILSRNCGPDTWPGYNIFIADFVHMNEYQFVKAVLSLNGLSGHYRKASPPLIYQKGDDKRTKTEKLKWKLLCCGSSEQKL